MIAAERASSVASSHPQGWCTRDTISFEPAAPALTLDRALRLRAIQPASRPLRAGDLVSGTPFLVLRRLGEGGMGEVYEVERGAGGPPCALKMLLARHRGRADLAARMRREASALGRFDHPNLVRVLDAGELADGRPYLAMELLLGRDLREELIWRGALPVPRALALVAQALDGLAVAHAAGVVHRDIKLENLFLCEDGTLKVLDFGLAKAPWAEASLTLPGVCFGTPRTMAPEQCALEAVDLRADLYAMGLVLFELCAGRGPFDDLAGQHDAMRFAHCRRAPPRPGLFTPQPLDPAVEALILRALAKSPEDRFQSAPEMARAIRAILTGDASSMISRAGRSPARRRPSRAPALLVGLAVMLFALGVAFGRALPAQGALRPSIEPKERAIAVDRGP